MFLLDSWLNHFTETIRRWYALSRSYSVNLPSSFSTAHPSALEYSSRLPVSVCGTGCYTRFSWKGFYSFASPEGSAQRPIPSGRNCHGSPSLSMYSRRRNINLLSITYPFRVWLRTGLTLIRLTLIRNPWSFGEKIFHLLNRYLCLHFLLKPLQQPSPVTFDAVSMLPYRSPPRWDHRASVRSLMPDYFPCGTSRPVSCYALFK